MSISTMVRSAFSRLGFTLKRFEFPADRPINVLSLLVDVVLPHVPTFQVLEIGANDGKSDDPVAPLIRRHRLRSLLVEPLPGMFEKLCEHYRDCEFVTLENCAVSHRDGNTTLYQVRPDPSLPEYVRRLASFDRAVILKQRRTVPTIERFIEPVTVPALTLKTLLAKHQVSSIDLLQVDTEGFDYEILRMLWNTNIRPTIINFESEHLKPQDKTACAAMLRSAGYSYLTFGFDTVAYRTTEASSPIKV